MIYDVVKAIYFSAPPPLVNTISFFLGSFVGYRVSISLDRRKELNKITVPIRGRLIRQIYALKSGAISAPVVSDMDIATVGAVTSERKYLVLRERLAGYEEAGQRENCGSSAPDGRFIVGNLDSYRVAAELLLAEIPVK